MRQISEAFKFRWLRASRANEASSHNENRPVLPPGGAYGPAAREQRLDRGYHKDLGSLEGIWQPRNSHRDVAFFSVGSVSKMSEVADDFVEELHLETNKIGAALGISATPADVQELMERAANRADRMEVCVGQDRVYTVSQRPPLSIITGVIGGRESKVGNGGHPEVAIQRLRTDPLIAETIEEKVNELAQCFMENHCLSASLIIPEGWGGTSPWQEYALQVFRTKVQINRVYHLFLLPAPELALNVANARAKLGHLILNGFEENELYFFHQFDRPGRHPQDQAILGALVTLASNDEPDRETMYQMIRERGNLVEIASREVYVPLVRVQETPLKSKKDGIGSTELVLLRAEDGGQQQTRVLNAIAQMVDKAPESWHLVVVLGTLSPEDEAVIKRQVRALLRPEQILVVVNPCDSPVVNSSAKYLVVDLQVSSGVPPSVGRFLAKDPANFQSADWTELEQLKLQVQDEASLQQVEVIQDAIMNVLRTRTNN